MKLKSEYRINEQEYFRKKLFYVDRILYVQNSSVFQKKNFYTCFVFFFQILHNLLNFFRCYKKKKL